jgi:hypothetical protein
MNVIASAREAIQSSISGLPRRPYGLLAMTVKKEGETPTPSKHACFRRMCGVYETNLGFIS